MSKVYLFIISIFFTFSCSKVNHVADYQNVNYRLTDSIAKDEVTSINELIHPYKTIVDAEMNQVIGQSATRLYMTFPEGTLGNFVSDILFQKAAEHYDGRVDFAFINYWSIRIEEIQKGPITKGHVYELMPFENHLVIMKVYGSTVFKLFENMAVKGGWPISNQVKFQIENGKAVEVMLNGKALQEDYIYHIAVSNYIANGGDGCSFFINRDRVNLDVMIRDMIMQGILDFTKTNETITAKIEGRVTLKK